MREWQIKRRERTRQLIELGGLVAKAGLVDLADDDRAMLFGAFLWMADKLRGDDGTHAAALWRRRGKRGFGEMDAKRKLAPNQYSSDQPQPFPPMQGPILDPDSCP